MDLSLNIMYFSILKIQWGKPTSFSSGGQIQFLFKETTPNYW